MDSIMMEERIDTIDSMRINNHLCDVTIVVGSKRINAHRLILAAGSAYFNAMFKSTMKESRERGVTLYGMNEDAVETIVNFIYTGQVFLSDTNIQELLAAAILFGMPDLMNRCCQNIREKINPANCIGIMVTGDEYSCPDLSDYARHYIKQLFDEVVKEKEFLVLTTNQLVYFISDDQLQTTSEERVYEAIIKWVNYDPQGRGSCLRKLLSYVHFDKMEPAYIDRILLDPLIRNCEGCREFVIKSIGHPSAQDQNQEKSMQGLYCGRKMKLKAPSQLYVIGGTGRDEKPLTEILKYDPKTNEWSSIDPQIELKHRTGITTLNDLVYIVGGDVFYGPVRFWRESVERYNPQTKKWDLEVAPLSSRRAFPAVASLNGFLYVIGGEDVHSTPFDIVEEYDPGSNRWSKCSPLSLKRSRAGVVGLGDFIYILGGAQGSTILNSMERYDPRSDQWQNMAPVPTKRASLGCVAYDGYIYAIGGCNELNKPLDIVERYNLRMDRWETTQMRLREARYSFGLSVINDKIYAVGGICHYLMHGATNTLEVLDPKVGRWLPCAPMPEHLYDPAVAAM